MNLIQKASARNSKNSGITYSWIAKLKKCDIVHAGVGGTVVHASETWMNWHATCVIRPNRGVIGDNT